MNWDVRQYQQEAVAACLGAFAERKCTSVMLESPVGSGKTYMALEVIHALQERLGRRLKVNWVAPRHHLLRQVMEANRALHQDVIRPVSLFERMPPEADFVVLDEAHHEATQTCILLYEKMGGEYVLGLSATPFRTDRMKLSFQDTVTTCTIDRLIREGFLSPIHSYLLPHYGPQSVAETYLYSRRDWGKTLVFFPTVLECNQFQQFMADAGVACEVVTAESDKDRQLEDFISGRVRVVANVSMLTEGFDQPDVQTIFARDASRLPTIQMCGRGLRLTEGKDHCNIVQSAKTPYLFERVTPARRRFRLMNGEWMALQDGTLAIETALQESLLLLERRERARAERKQKHPMVASPGAGAFVRAALGQTAPGGDSRSVRDISGSERTFARRVGAVPHTQWLKDELPRFGNLFHLPPFYAVFEDVYRHLYWIYGLCNHYGWSGTLPPVAMILNRSKRPTHVAGYANPQATAVNGQVYCGISLTLNICARGNTSSFIPILLHEMTHVWQFSKGQRGGHGKGFRNEMLRLGIDESYGGGIRDGSPAVRIMQEAERRHPGLAARMRQCLASPLRSTKQEDFAFFRMVLENGNK